MDLQLHPLHRLVSLDHTLQPSINNKLFSSATGAFYDSDTNPHLYPQDANSMALAYSFSPPNTTSTISTQLLTNWSPIGSVSPELPGPNNIVAYTSSVEVKAHLVSRNPLRSLALMRLFWGWYLNNLFGTQLQSTFIEEYLSDGTWSYRSANGYNGDYSYTSHSHGWGTGPVEVLITGVLGIHVQLTGARGSEWSIVPQFGDLRRTEGGFTAALGKFSAGWSLTGETGYVYWYKVPVGTNGTLVLPAGNVMPRVDVDGVLVDREGTYDDVLKMFNISGKGGSHSLTITY